jgi:hypothetical protein
MGPHFFKLHFLPAEMAVSPVNFVMSRQMEYGEAFFIKRQDSELSSSLI